VTWTKIDDGFHDNPKIVEAGNAAAGLYVRALSWSSAKGTDGLVPRGVALMLAGTDGPGLVERLLGARLWVECDGGYRPPHFLEYNPPAGSPAAARARLSGLRAEAGKRGAAKRWQTNGNGRIPAAVGMANGHGKDSKTDGNDGKPPTEPGSAGADDQPAKAAPAKPGDNQPGDGKPNGNCHGKAVANGWQTDSPVPVPDPEIEKKKTAAASGAREGEAAAVAAGEINGMDAAITLRAAANGKLHGSLTPAMAVAFGATLRGMQRQHPGVDLVALLGAYAAAGGFGWMTHRPPTLGWLLEDDGARFAEAIDEALVWNLHGRPPPKPRPKLVSVPAAPPPAPKLSAQMQPLKGKI
jgi:hypothetical protein